MMLRILILVLLSGFIFSCKKVSLANFTEAQPVNKQNLKYFPKRYVGTYRNLEDKSVLILERERIVKKYEVEDTLSKKEFSEFAEEEFLVSKKLNDSSYYMKDVFIDTIFNIYKGDILRKFKGYYFLNQEESNLWYVKKLKLKGDFLNLNSITTKEEIDKLNSIIDETAEDTITRKTYNLNRKQFKEFIKENGFSEGETYIKE